MKASTRFWRLPLLVSVLVVFLSGIARADLDRPVITAIQPTRNNVLVTVSVPAGIRQVTIEGRARFGGGSWEPRAVVRTDGTAGSVTVSLDFARELEILRVKASPTAALPTSFYAGTNSFNSPPATSTSTPESGGIMIYGMSDSGSLEVRNPTTDGGSTTRDVVESDIWKISGNTLYYFNQNRGLQIIDITNPDQSALRGTLPLPAVGEQMYQVDEQHVALLARASCNSYGFEAGRVIVVNVAGPEPRQVASVAVGGRIVESRMVGDVLYVSSAAYRSSLRGTNTVWEYGTMLESFDLAIPSTPVSRGSLWLPGYSDDAVAATDTFLFVASHNPTNYYRSILHVIDITSPDGVMNEHAALNISGQIKDKFKMHHVNGILTTIAEDWNPGGTNRLITRLETWRLPDPRLAGPLGVAKLGQLELGGNEQLHATRFDGNRVYVVTFFRVDPLWVVDLSDPANPRISGELQVPGWSTYIQPLGDRLVAVGVETNHVAVSLFDVSDPARPRLFNKVLMGEGYSWSEANFDEKAFTVLPSANLILIPYGGFSSNGYAERVQLIDLNATNLVARGVIDHQCQPRRATVANGRVLSLSWSELLSVNATDRDHPVVTKTLDLAWPVDRVFVVGDYLIQLAEGQYYYSGWQANSVEVRVSPLNNPNHVLKTLRLAGMPAAGATLRGNELFIAQAQASYFYPIIVLNGAGSDTNVPAAANFILSVIDLSGLPEIRVAGSQGITTESSGYGQSWTPVWPNPNLLVWVNSQSYPYFMYRPMGGPMGFTDAFWGGYPYYWQGGGQMLAFNVSQPTAPALVSTVNLSTNGWFSFSKPFAAENLVLLSHGGYWRMEPIIIPFDPTTGESGGTNYQLRYEQKHFLDVVDFSDPKEPLVRKPVNIPGALTGISHGGNVLYTQGQHYDPTGKTDYTQWLDASAYDGVAAYLVDSLKLPNTWPQAVAIQANNIFVAESTYSTTSNPPSASITWWTLNDTGKFAALSRVAVTNYVENLATPPGLLGAKDSSGNIYLYEPVAGVLRPVGQSQIPACVYTDFTKSDGAAGQGLWVPLANYGVQAIPVAPIVITPALAPAKP